MILIFLAFVALFVAVLLAARVVQSGVDAAGEANVPKTAKTISYVLLVVLMFGVITGWLGGL